MVPGRLLRGVALVALALLPAAAATVGPAACVGVPAPCAHSFAYLPPVFEVASGGSVVWTSADTTHVNKDGTGSSLDPDACFVVGYGRHNPSDPVRFDITGAGLVAVTAPGTPGQWAAACASAASHADGSFTLPYFCDLHPQMRGAVRVRPA